MIDDGNWEGCRKQGMRRDKMLGTVRHSSLDTKYRRWFSPVPKKGRFVEA